MTAQVSIPSSTPQQEDSEDPPLHTEEAWRSEIAKLRDNYSTIIQAGNPYAMTWRNNHNALMCIDTLELPDALRTELRDAIQRGFNASGFDHQHSLSRRLAEYTFTPWLKSELEHFSGNAERQQALLQMFDEEMEGMPIAREHTYRRAIMDLLGTKAIPEISSKCCSADDVISTLEQEKTHLQVAWQLDEREIPLGLAEQPKGHSNAAVA